MLSYRYSNKRARAMSNARKLPFGSRRRKYWARQATRYHLRAVRTIGQAIPSSLTLD